MNKILIVFLIILFPVLLFGQDTSFYQTGQIKCIINRPYFSRKDYYINGQLNRYIKSDNFFRKGKEINYDSLGNVISKGKIKFRYIQHGMWKYYDNDIVTKKIYKYGVDKTTLFTNDGKKKACFLTYGKGCMIKPCVEASEKYKVEFISVSGCIINTNIFINANTHNFFVNIRQSMRYGIRWKKKAFELCKK